jgi:hypothetical protein
VNGGSAFCTNTQTNASHCGSCDRTCLFTERCENGECVPDTSVGTGRLVPASAAVARGRRIQLALTWTVPPPGRWSDLTSLELRLHDSKATTLSVLWDEPTGVLRLVDPAARTPPPAGVPRQRAVLATRRVKLVLAESAVDDGGPSGQDVTVAVTLAFRPGRARTYAVDAVAIDDGGRLQVAPGLGTLRVGKRRGVARATTAVQ